MATLLKKYLIKTEKFEYVDIKYFNVDGANCEVHFYTDPYHICVEKRNINVWNFVLNPGAI